MIPIVLIPVSASMPIVPKEAMRYKEQIKTSEIITKIRIIRYVLKDHIPSMELSKSFSCHRNTIRNIIRAFEKNVSEDDKALLLTGETCSSEKLVQRYKSILNKKRIPKTHRRMASGDDGKKIRVGIKQMKIILDQRFGKNQGLAHLTIGQLRGIYQRNNFKT